MLSWKRPGAELGNGKRKIVRTRREKLWMGMSFTLALCLAFSNPHTPEVSAKEASGPDLYAQLKTFTDVLALVERDYVQEVDGKRVVEGAIRGMLGALDPHSGYLDPDFYQDLQAQTKGEFGGLGIEITIRDGLLVVVAPMEGSPAEKVGVKPGDVIVKIGGQYTKEFSLVDAVKRLRGPQGSPINISVLRKGSQDLIDYSIVRENIEVRSVRGKYLGEGVAYARISQFVEKTTDDLKSLLKKIKDQTSDRQLRGLVLDLRNNPGGLLNQAVQVSDLFLEEGIIVYTDGRKESQKQKFYAHARGTEPNYPIVVLVNSGSASASEIVAGALKDHGRALILGTQTFGKGSVQTITPLDNGGAITLTTALYYTKSGRSLQALGVSPDVEMDAPPAEDHPDSGVSRKAINEKMRERDLPGAIKNPTEKEEDRPKGLREINKTPEVRPDLTRQDPEKEDVKTLFARDPQLQRAVELLKTFRLFKS